VAFLDLPAAAARTRVVSPGALRLFEEGCLLAGNNPHYIGGRAAVVHEVQDHPQGLVDVMKELLEAGT
jgi:hypothetical protein